MDPTNRQSIENTIGQLARAPHMADVMRARLAPSRILPNSGGYVDLYNEGYFKIISKVKALAISQPETNGKAQARVIGGIVQDLIPNLITLREIPRLTQMYNTLTTEIPRNDPNFYDYRFKREGGMHQPALAPMQWVIERYSFAGRQHVFLDFVATEAANGRTWAGIEWKINQWANSVNSGRLSSEWMPRDVQKRKTHQPVINALRNLNWRLKQERVVALPCGRSDRG